MKHLKTYEGLFDFFNRKKPFDDASIVDKVKDTLIDLSDNGFVVKVDRVNRGSLIGEDIPEIVISIGKEGVDVPSWHTSFNIIDIVDALKFTSSYLKDETGLKLFDIDFREDKWTHTGNRGTKKIIRYTRLSQIKKDDTSNLVRISFR